jgi:hypothetical protein
MSRILYGITYDAMYSYAGPNVKRILIARISEAERELILGGNIERILRRKLA